MRKHADSVNWQSDSFSDSFDPVGNPFRFEQESFALVNLMVRLNVSDNFLLQANVDNLFDETYYSQIGFFQQYRYGRERNFTIGATYRFQ